MRRAARVDANQREIIDALRAAGASVQPLHTVGDGVPDLLVGKHGRTHLIEIKDGSKRPSERRLTSDQQEWHAWWRGTPVYIVQSADEALAAIAAAT